MTQTGKQVLSFCGSCRMDLSHTIVAMLGDRIIKVECRTCKKIHAYKSAKGINEPVPKSTKIPGKNEPTKIPIEVEWERLIKTSAKPPKTYTIRTAFIEGDKLVHVNFGMGIVKKVIPPNKIEVVFKDDIRLLVTGLK